MTLQFSPLSASPTRSKWFVAMFLGAVMPIIVASLICTPALARSAKRMAGPVSARVVDIYDGDTIHVIAEVWPQQEVDVKVRLRGIDAPEIHSRCWREKQAGLEARDYLRDLVGRKKLLLSNISGDKYFGRVLADVEMADGTDLASTLMANDLVVPYSGGRRRPYCQAN